MKESIKEKLAEPIRNFRLPRYRELPDVGLYLEQVVRYVNRYMILDGNELTPSMVSNYVKKGLISNPVKKKYSRDQIAVLIYLTLAKTVISLEDIQLLIELKNRSYDNKTAFDYFKKEFSKSCL